MSAALQAHLAHGIAAVVTRTFNPLGSGQPVSPVASGLARLRVRDSAQEIEDHFGSPGRLKAETDWEPGISFENSLADMLEHWRKVLKEKEIHELA